MRKEKVIENIKSLDASLSAKLVEETSKYDADVKLYYKDKVANLKSILGLMSLAIPKGESVKVASEGKDATLALKEIESLLK